MYYDRITTTAEVVRNDNGDVQCGSSREKADLDYSRQGWDSARTSYNATTTSLSKNDVITSDVKGRRIRARVHHRLLPYAIPG